MKNYLALFFLFTILIGCKTDPQPTLALESIPLQNSKIHLDQLQQAMANGDTVKIVCYGNSVTYGVSVTRHVRVDTTYPVKLQQLLQSHYNNPNITVINEGYGGWTAPMAAGGLDTLVSPHQADWVIIMFGINDYFRGVSLIEYQDALFAMIQGLKANQSKVLVLSPTPITTTEADMQGLWEFCKAAKLTAMREDVAFFHMNDAIVQRIHKDNLQHETVLPDKIHFEDDRYALIAEALFEFFTE